MIKNFITAIALLFAIVYPFVTQAQLEKIYPADSIEKLLRQERFEIDGGAAAIILYDAARAELDFDKPFGSWDISFEKVIKIVSSEAQDIGEVQLPYYKQNPIKNIYFESYRLKEGKLEKISSQKSDLIKEKVVDDIRILKFQIPNTSPGSIVYYRFSYNDFAPRSDQTILPFKWVFNNFYPTIHSRFEVVTPESFEFFSNSNIIRFDTIGDAQQLFSNPAAYFKQILHKNGVLVTNRTRTEVWSRNKIHPIKSEEMVLNTDNYLEKLSFYSYFTGKNSDTWQEANISFLTRKKFIENISLTTKDSILHRLNSLIPKGDTSAFAAATVYKFVRDSITTIKTNNKYRNIGSTFSNRKGTEEEKKYLLCWLLNARGIKTIPIIISKTEYGRLDPEFQLSRQVTHLVLASVIDGSLYYHDPSSKYLPFGVIPSNYYNGFSWGITDNGLPINLSADSSIDQNSYTVTLRPNEDKNLYYDITVEHLLGINSSYYFRKEFSADSVSLIEQIKNPFRNHEYQIEYNGFKIHFIDEPDSLVKIVSHFKMRIPFENNQEYFTPILLGKFSSNPFNQTNRTYPVELGECYRENYSLVLQLPEGYEVEELPRTANISLPEKKMTYTLNCNNDGNLIKYLSQFNINRSSFPKEQYPILRKYMDGVINSQNQKIILKRKL